MGVAAVGVALDRCAIVGVALSGCVGVAMMGV